MRPTVKVGVSDKQRFVGYKLKELQRQQVYVGIPEEKASRKKGRINNAQLLFIHTNGSPLKKIPARPVIEPAIAQPENKARITEELGDAARDIMADKPSSAKQHLNRAGMLGRNAAIRWFTDAQNGWPPNSPRTIARKLARLRGRKKKEALAQIAEQGGTDGVVTPLVDTGEMRRAITYIVSE
jgi:hypothetical protein